MAVNTEVTFIKGRAETGDVDAQLTLADMYAKGYGISSTVVFRGGKSGIGHGSG
jgi:hypothetical protein